MAEQPTGTVTMLFTDIEGSTRLLERLGRDRYAQALELHRRLLRAAFDRHGGYEVDCEGDAFFVAFASAEEAVAAATEAQQALAAADWPDGQAFRVRMGLHTGEPLAVPPKYVGLDVHLAARIMAAGHGGQVLVSQTTRDLVTLELRDLGEHRLKDISERQRLFQLGAGGFPPITTLENRTNNLPVQPTALVGRLRELGELRALLGREDVRLVTVTGPGGIGKTRVALHAAAELIESFPDGVYFISLAPLRDAELIVPTVAVAVGVRERPGQALLDTLIEFLKERRMLLVLDNFEHLLEGAPTVASLLSGAEELHVLATSRGRLRISGEHAYALMPLAVPGAQVTSAETAIESPAVALFVQRARAANAQFDLRSDNVGSVVEICRRVDGLPLALELAAARVATLTPAVLAARLDKRLAVLTSGARDASERQRTLRRTIEWSYELLLPDEQRLFARLSVFAGGWTFQAAEAVCDAALDPFATLVDSSLVTADRDRYRMLETIREFAGDQLEVERADLQRRHATYYADVLGQAMARLDADASAAITLEQDNVRGALRWAIDARDGELAARLGVQITYFWFLRNNLTEARAWLSEIKTLDCGSDPLRAGLLRSEGAVAQGQADFETAASANEACLVIRRRLGEAAEIAAALNNLAVIHMFTGRFERARELFRECTALARSSGDELSVASANCNLGVIAYVEEDYPLAEQLLREAVEIARRADHSYGLAASLENLGPTLVGAGKPAEAWPVFEEALSLHLMLGDEVGAAGTIENVAAAIALAGRADAAARLLGAADAVRLTNDYVAPPLEVDLTKRTAGRVRDLLPAGAFDRAYGEGAALTLRDAAREAGSLGALLLAERPKHS